MDSVNPSFHWKAVALAALLALAGCGKKPAPAQATPGQDAQAPAAAGQPALPAKPLPPGPPEIWKSFSGEKAFDEMRKQVEVGPRPAGSQELEKARVLIEAGLKREGWDVERQTFTAQTPRGPMPMVNVIGRFSPTGAKPAQTGTQQAIVCSHYDTKRFSAIQFLGANDAGSSTGALIELARVLALDPALAMKVELVFFDGEEAVVQFNETDGLYGSRHYASQLRATGRAQQFKFGILWDMIGDRDFKITLPPDSPPELARGIIASAEALGVRDRFGYHDRSIYDDHVPLNTIAKIPSINLIDFDYLYWHTADDKLDRVGPEGLEKTGAVTLHYLRQALK